MGDAIFGKLLELLLKTTVGQVVMLTLFGAAAVAVGVYARTWYFAIGYGALLALLLLLKLIRRGRPAESSGTWSSAAEIEALGHTGLTRAIIWLVWLLIAGGFWVLEKAVERKHETWLLAAAGFYGLVFLWSLISGRIFWGGPHAMAQRDRQPLVYLVLLTTLLALCAGPLVLYAFFWDRLRGPG